MNRALRGALLASLLVGACAEPEGSEADASRLCDNLQHPRIQEPIAGARNSAEQAFEHPGHRAEHCAAMELELERTVAFTEGFFTGARDGEARSTIRTDAILTEMTEARAACDRATRSETLAILERMDQALTEDRAAITRECP